MINLINPLKNLLAGLSLFLLLIICASIPYKACGSSSLETSTRRIFCPVAPIAYLVDEIGGGKFTAQALIKPGHTPHDYTLTPKDLQQLSNAECYLSLGLSFEKHILLPTIKRLPLKLVFLGQTIERLPVVEASHIHASAACESSSDDEHNYDQHLWLSARNAIILSNEIAQTLIELDPDNQELYSTNLQTLLKKFNDIDQHLTQTLTSDQHHAFFVYHPAFGYFARDYNWQQLAIESGNKPPTPRRLLELTKQAEREDIKVIFIQKEFNPASAQTIAQAIGGEVVQLDILSYDLAANLLTIGEALKRTRPDSAIIEEHSEDE